MAIENSGTATPGASNTIQRLPSPPFIHVPGLTNLRDAGGCTLENIPGKAVRRGILFRSAADPCKLDATGVAMLLRLGITHVFDLRSVIELGRSGIQGHGVSGDQGQVHDDQAMCGTGIKRLFVPVFLDKDYSPEALAERFGHYSDGPEGFMKAYATILAAAADPNHPYAPFRTILEHLASRTAPTPVLIHCTAGKDRTGVIIALILALCHVSDETIADEYSLTEIGLASRKEEIIQRLIRPGEALEGDREKAERMVSARKENMLLTLRMIREKYGSVEKYVTEHLGISRESVEQIRRNLIVDVEESSSDKKEREQRPLL
ncbi:uncharacterized protein CTHT_0011380 [Thermochaetoides thermophila DSM 1495]|uniref:Tyrosine specific protein phosphatases domain-containing protein n=1 Tax=Chaetomium thermophilum (strain DSM 1495 / CBS 144.50 / IMI 039719) TaxID=759272 RepID=G0S0V5_CHATD|nr:hypothetical protein CTHT_0011380 [Thermochaetoides thermophila DSM 1495]EGS22665.1 hypothetical protein CTHT_0011380 [Thermochaetoides thermophila DSM 1495]